MAGTAYDGGGIRSTVAATRAATDEQLTANLVRLLGEMRRQGTTTVEVKSGYGLTVADEARALALARELTPETTFLGAHVVPRGVRRRPGRLRRPGHRPDARRLRAARQVDRRVLRARCVRRRPGTGGAHGRCGPRPARAAARQPARPRPGRPAGLRARPGRRRPLHLPLRGRRGRPGRQRHHRHAAAGGGVLHPLALPRRSPAPRRRRHGGARLGLQPGLVLLQLDAADGRSRRPGDADDPGRGASRRPRSGGRPRCAATTSATCGSAPGPTWSCSTRRRTCTSPTAPACPSSTRSSAARSLALWGDFQAPGARDRPHKAGR